MNVAAIAAGRSYDTRLPILRYVDQEANHLVEIARGAGVSATCVSGQSATKSKAIELLKSSNIVHLACHGIQDGFAPHESHFCLSDAHLSVSELVNLDLKYAFFAFLSACETAKGDQRNADEVVHLAATMLFTGFASVVATMW
jgi:CHAT domain-containing protein